jgi:hypothetical protein
MRLLPNIVAGSIALFAAVNGEPEAAPPMITPAPSFKFVAELLKRQINEPGFDTCGFADGDASEFCDPRNHRIF